MTIGIIIISLILRVLIMPLKFQQRAWLLRAIVEVDQVHALDPFAEVGENQNLMSFRGTDRDAMLLLAQHGFDHLPRAWIKHDHNVARKRVNHLLASSCRIRAGKAPHPACRGRARQRFAGTNQHPIHQPSRRYQIALRVDGH